MCRGDLEGHACNEMQSEIRRAVLVDTEVRQHTTGHHSTTLIADGEALAAWAAWVCVDTNPQRLFTAAPAGS